MNEHDRMPERDEVLFAFHQTCDNPTTEQLNEWTRRYPQYADDIRAHAAVRAQWASDSDEHDAQPDESMLARGRSHALNLLHSARQESVAAQDVPEKTWPQAVSAAGAELKRELGGLREEVAMLRAKIERMEGDIQILYDKWALDPKLKAEIERVPR